MLSKQINNAICIIKDLIEGTKKDIQDIKKAKHDDVFNRIEQKNNLIDSFLSTKKSMDDIVSSKLQEDNKADIESILQKDEIDKLNSLKKRLTELQEINKKYSRMVFAIGELYNGMLENIAPSINNGYKKERSSSVFLQLKA